LIKILKNRPVQFGFGFISLKLKKPNRTESKPKKPEKTESKPSQTEKTKSNKKKRVESVFILKNQNESKRVGLNRFQFNFDFE